MHGVEGTDGKQWEGPWKEERIKMQMDRDQAQQDAVDIN